MYLAVINLSDSTNILTDNLSATVFENVIS